MSPKRIPLSEPTLGGNEWRYVKECLDSGWVSSAGPWVERFEQAVAKATGAAHAVAIVNGTAALHLALELSGVRRGDLVLLPNLTFVAPANAALYCGADPVFIDCDPATWQLDDAKLERYLREECRIKGGVCVEKRSGRVVRAMIPVHLLGLACEIEKIAALARRYKVALVEDACEGLGVRFNKRHVGTFGKLGVLSFNGNKIATTGGGGMILTSDDKLARRTRYLSNQAKDDPIEYFHRERGYNYRLTSLQAALGLAQLEQLPGFVAGKRRVAALYEKAFAGSEIVLMPRPPKNEPSFWLYTVLLPERIGLAGRKRVIAGLEGQGIGARPLWHHMHELPAFRRCRAYEIEHSPSLYRRAVSLPSGPALSRADVARVAGALLKLTRGK